MDSFPENFCRRKLSRPTPDDAKLLKDARQAIYDIVTHDMERYLGASHFLVCYSGAIVRCESADELRRMGTDDFNRQYAKDGFPEGTRARHAYLVAQLARELSLRFGNHVKTVHGAEGALYPTSERTATQYFRIEF